MTPTINLPRDGTQENDSWERALTGWKYTQLRARVSFLFLPFLGSIRTRGIRQEMREKFDFLGLRVRLLIWRESLLKNALPDGQMRKDA